MGRKVQEDWESEAVPRWIKSRGALLSLGLSPNSYALMGRYHYLLISERLDHSSYVLNDNQVVQEQILLWLLPPEPNTKLFVKQVQAWAVGLLLDVNVFSNFFLSLQAFHYSM